MSEISPATIEAFIDNVPGLAWLLDSQGKFVRCNNEFYRQFDFRPEQVIGYDVKALLGDELGAICLANRKAILATGEKREFVQSLPQANGVQADYLINEFPLKAQDGTIYFGGIGIDITEQLLAKNKLKQSEFRLTRLNRLYSVLSQINEIIVRAADQQELLDAVCRIVVTKGDIELAWIGLHDKREDLVIPTSTYGPNASYIQNLKITPANAKNTGPAARALRTGVYATSNDIQSDSTFANKEQAAQYNFQSCGAFPFNFNSHERGILMIYSKSPQFFQTEQNQLFQSLAEDLSYAMHSIRSKERVQTTQAQLSDSQRQLTTLFSNLPGMAYCCDLDEFWTMEFISEGCADLTGYQPEELIGNKQICFEELIHPDDRDWVREDVQLALSRKARFELTYRINHRTKGERWLWERGQGIPGSDGSITRLEGFISDVTDQQIAYSRMRDQAELIDQAHDAIIVFNSKGEILFWNQGATRLYGYPRQEAQGALAATVLGTRGDRLKEAMREVKRAGEWSGELVRTCADGTEKTVESRWTTVSDAADGEKTILTIDSDITERRNLEKQFLRAQRMESVGNLAGGIAHDLNNILSPIMMSAELLEEVISGEPERKILKRIEDGARRAADLVQQLLSFSRGLDSSRKPVYISDLIPDMKVLVYDAVAGNIKIQFEAEENLPQIRANPVQLNQVLLNLSLNARDAMDGDGCLSIKIYKNTKTQVPPEIIPGNFVVIEVSDTGSGIPEEMRDKIFEPFFSTKLESRGTGLGLSTSLSIVQNHGGFIDLITRANEGTIFRVFLPALGMVLDPEEEDDGTEAPIRDTPEATILVVDDELSMRDVLAKTLEKQHFRVETACHGQEALDFIQSSAAPVDIVLTDINMPVLNGIELARIIKEEYPKITVIAMSGFEQEHSLNTQHDIKGLFATFIGKPFTSKQLSEIIQKCRLDSSSVSET